MAIASYMIIVIPAVLQGHPLAAVLSVQKAEPLAGAYPFP